MFLTFGILFLDCWLKGGCFRCVKIYLCLQQGLAESTSTSIGVLIKGRISRYNTCVSIHRKTTEDLALKDYEVWWNSKMPQKKINSKIFKYCEISKCWTWLQLIYNTIVSILAEGLTCNYQSKTEITRDYVSSWQSDNLLSIHASNLHFLELTQIEYKYCHVS